MLEKLPIEDRHIFRQMADDEIYYIDLEFAYSSDSAIKAAIKESVDELARGFPSLISAEILAYMTKKWEAKRSPISRCV
jgi:hypothetical protein